jgi:hypothetical protein
MYSKQIINFIQEEFKNSETIVEFDIQNETEFVLVLNNEKNSFFKFIEEKLTPEMNNGRTFSMKHINIIVRTDLLFYSMRNMSLY